MSNDNSVIVKKSQAILREFGYEVKMGHIYEMYAQLSSYSSYNVAKTKGVEFTPLLNSDVDLTIQQAERAISILEELADKDDMTTREDFDEFMFTFTVDLQDCETDTAIRHLLVSPRFKNIEDKLAKLLAKLPIEIDGSTYFSFREFFLKELEILK